VDGAADGFGKQLLDNSVRKAMMYTPTLTGLADRKHLLHSDINLSTHIQEIANLIEYEELNDVVLCGHSYAGMVTQFILNV
jgi:hypothetical protein